MKNNKYLKELGYEWYDLPGIYDEKLIETDLNGVAATDCRNKEDEEGFCGYEFFSLDHTLSLYIYSKITYFREHIADMSTPGCLCPRFEQDLSIEEREMARSAAHKKWLSIVDKMILAFKIKLKGCRDGYEGIDMENEREGMQLFIEYYDCLWY